MLYKTRGVVFKFFKYRETSIIIKIFTEEFGLQTYIVNGARSKSAKNKIALFQPLTLLDLVVYHKPSTEINRISEIKCRFPFQSISTDIKKTTIAIFIAEILYKSVKEEGEVTDLFGFIYHSIEIFDHLENGFENFHLQFLLKLAKYLGFGIENSEHYFAALEDEETAILKMLLVKKYEESIKISNSLRRNLLDNIISFYQTHIDSLKEINSLKVLKEIF